MNSSDELLALHPDNYTRLFNRLFLELTIIGRFYGVLYQSLLQDYRRSLGQRHKVQVLFIMRTAYSTSRQVYPSTLLSKIAEKRQTYHARFMESAFKDLHQVYQMELSRKPVAFYLA